MSAFISVSVWVLAIVMVGYAVYRNLSDVSRAKSLQAQIKTIKEEFALQTKATEKHHTEALANVRLSLFEKLQAEYSPPATIPKPGPRAHGPHLTVHYKLEGNTEKLVFTNDGHATVQNIEIGPLTWLERKAYQFAIPNKVPPIPVNKSEECQIFFQRDPWHGERLYSFMRESTPPEARTCVTANYQDSSGMKFRQTFVLTAGTREGMVTWESLPPETASVKAAL